MDLHTELTIYFAKDKLSKIEKHTYEMASTKIWLAFQVSRKATNELCRILSVYPNIIYTNNLVFNDTYITSDSLAKSGYHHDISYTDIYDLKKKLTVYKNKLYMLTKISVDGFSNLKLHLVDVDCLEIADEVASHYRKYLIDLSLADL